VEWLKERIERVSVRLVFESALELMGTTQLGSFKASLSLQRTQT
jgi:magnesium chelatase subunit H